MLLRFLGKESLPDQSPTLYRTDQDSYVIQGWIVTDAAALAAAEVAADENLVEIPPKLLSHLAKDGLSGDVAHVAPPIVYVLPNGNYVVKGARVIDPATLNQMHIPADETCVAVARTAAAALVTK